MNVSIFSRNNLFTCILKLLIPHCDGIAQMWFLQFKALKRFVLRRLAFGFKASRQLLKTSLASISGPISFLITVIIVIVASVIELQCYYM